MTSTTNVSVIPYGTLIVGWRLQGRHILIVGGNQVAANRLHFALDAKPAKITLISPRAQVTSERITQHIKNDDINYIDREFLVSDLDEIAINGHGAGRVDLVLSAMGDLHISEKIAKAARERHIPVNIAEHPQLCDFLFMPTYKDQYLQVAVSTNSDNLSSHGNGDANEIATISRKLRQHVLNSLPKQKDITAAINNLALLKENLGHGLDVSSALSKITETLPLDQLASLSKEDVQRLVAEHGSMEAESNDVDEVESRSTSSSTLDEKSSDATSVEETLVIKSKIDNDIMTDKISTGSQLVDGKTAVAHIAYALSDASFIYPASRTRYIGQAAEKWASDNVRNVFDRVTQVVRMETRSGAATAILGVATVSDAQSHVSAFATSQTIVNMIPNFYAISRQQIPLVIHVAAQGNDNEMNNYANYHDVFVSSETGFGIVNSYSVQEVHDIALLAHFVSILTKNPFLHVFDGVRTVHELSKAHLLSSQDIAKLTREILTESLSADVKAFNNSNSIITQIEAITKKLNQFTGRPYNFFEYVGSRDAETVLVVMGGETPNIKETVTRFGSHYDGKVAAVIVRVYRPWSTKHFLAVIPKSAKRIAVLEQVSDANTEPNRLFSDVTASFQSGDWTSNIPILVDAKYSVAQHFNSRTVRSILHQLVTGTNVNFTDELSSAIDVSVPLHNLKQCIFWDSEAKSSGAQATKHIANILACDPQTSLSSLSTFDIYNDGGVITTHLRFGTDRISGPYDGEADADYIAIHDDGLVKKYNILGVAKEHAVVLLNTNWSVDDLETKLTSDFRFEAARQNIQLYIIDAEKIVQEANLNAEAINLIFQVSFLKLYGNAGLDEVLQDAVANFYEGASEKEVARIVREIFGQTEKSLTRVELPPTWLPLGRSDAVLPTAIANNSFGPNLDVPNQRLPTKLSTSRATVLNLLFKEAYGSAQEIRPDIPEETFVTRITENRRLTPSAYDRNLFHIEFDISGTSLKYALGEALGVYGHNDPTEVNQFLEFYGLNPSDVVSMPSKEGDRYETRTILQLFSQVLDLFGRPSKRFYESLALYATDENEKSKLLWIASSEGAEDYKRRVEDTITFADLLYEFQSAKPPAEDLVHLIAPIKPRHYSIASAQSVHPNSVHLLVVTVDWVTSSGKKRFGQCTRYLAGLKVGEQVTVSIKPSVMKLPPLDAQPVIMAGLGTGMAPFRAFIEERAHLKSKGIEVGPMVLYFGSRYRSMEYLYGEELEAYHNEGVLTHLRLAFSRDQPRKVYIQHKMQEDAEILHDMLLKQEGHFYLCGPTWPVPDVRDAIVNSFVSAGGLSPNEASDWVNKLKDLEKYILEVY